MLDVRALFSNRDLAGDIDESGSVSIQRNGIGAECDSDMVKSSGSVVTIADEGIYTFSSALNDGVIIVCGKDGIHAENGDDTALGYAYIQSESFDITAEGAGISASSQLQINSGSFTIVTGGGSVNAQQHTSDNWGGFGGMGSGDMFALSDGSNSTISSSTLMAV